MNLDEIFTAITAERNYQDQMWGTEFDDKNTPNDWASYILRYTARGCDFNLTPEKFKSAMVKVAALAVAAVESVERTRQLVERHYD
jgi:hypothetical protein